MRLSDDVRLIIEELFDIRTEFRAIVALLEKDDDTERGDEADS